MGKHTTSDGFEGEVARKTVRIYVIILLDLKTWRCLNPKRWYFDDEEWRWRCCRCF